jgi:branched-chain amino acid transport system substrate-binding protein
MNLRQRLLLLGCAVLIVSSAAAPARADTQGLTDKEILIGTHLSLTGPASSIGQGFKAGEDMAIAEINAHGGINGRTVKVVYEDDAGTAEGGVSAVRRLIDQDKVFAIFAGGTSTSTAAVIPLIQQTQILYYDSVASDPRVLQIYSPYVFSGTAVVRSDLAQFALHAITDTLKAKTLAFLTSDEAACANGVRLLQPLVESAGIKVVTVQTFRSGATDFTAQSLALRDANADVIYLCGLPADGGRFLPQLRRAGVKSKLLGDGLLVDSVLTQNAGSSADGMYGLWTAAPQFIGETSGPVGEFKKRFAKFYPNPVPGTPNGFSVASYADFYDFTEGLRRAGRDLDKDKVVAALETLNGYVAGRDRDSSWAVPVGKPRTFKKGDHKGSREAHLLIVRNGEFVAL